MTGTFRHGYAHRVGESTPGAYRHGYVRDGDAAEGGPTFAPALIGVVELDSGLSRYGCADPARPGFFAIAGGTSGRESALFHYINADDLRVEHDALSVYQRFYGNQSGTYLRPDREGGFVAAVVSASSFGAALAFRNDADGSMVHQSIYATSDARLPRGVDRNSDTHQIIVGNPNNSISVVYLDDDGNAAATLGNTHADEATDVAWLPDGSQFLVLDIGNEELHCFADGATGSTAPVWTLDVGAITGAWSSAGFYAIRIDETNSKIWISYAGVAGQAELLRADFDGNHELTVDCSGDFGGAGTGVLVAGFDLDPDGNVYVVMISNTSSAGDVVSYDPDGVFRWSMQDEGVGTDALDDDLSNAAGIAVDADGRIAVWASESGGRGNKVLLFSQWEATPDRGDWQDGYDPDLVLSSPEDWAYLGKAHVLDGVANGAQIPYWRRQDGLWRLSACVEGTDRILADDTGPQLLTDPYGDGRMLNVSRGINGTHDGWFFGDRRDTRNREGLTIAFLVDRATTSSTFRTLYFQSTGTSDTNPRAQVEISGTTIRIRGRRLDGDSTVTVTSSSGVFTSGILHTIFCRWDWANREMSAWINGTKVASSTVLGSSGGATSDTTPHAAYLAGDEDDACTVKLLGVHGWHSALSDAEIGDLTTELDAEYYTAP